MWWVVARVGLQEGRSESESERRFRKGAGGPLGRSQFGQGNGDIGGGGGGGPFMYVQVLLGSKAERLHAGFGWLAKGRSPHGGPQNDGQIFSFINQSINHI